MSDYGDHRSRSPLLSSRREPAAYRPRSGYDDGVLYDRGGYGNDRTSAPLHRPAPVSHASTKMKIFRKSTSSSGGPEPRDETEPAATPPDGWSTRPRTVKRVTRVVSRGAAAADPAAAARGDAPPPRLVFRDGPPDPEQRFTVSIPEPAALPPQPPPPPPPRARSPPKQNSPSVQAVQYIQRFDSVIQSGATAAQLPPPPTPDSTHRLLPPAERQPPDQYVTYDGVQETSTSRTQRFAGAAHPAVAPAASDPVAYRRVDERDFYRSELTAASAFPDGLARAPPPPEPDLATTYAVSETLPSQPQPSAGGKRKFVSKIFQQENAEPAPQPTIASATSRVYVQYKSGVSQHADEPPPTPSAAPPAAADRTVTTIVQTADLPTRTLPPPPHSVSEQPGAREKSVIFISQSGDEAARRATAAAIAAGAPPPPRDEGPRIDDGENGDGEGRRRLKRDISVVESVLAALTRTYDAEGRHPGALDDDPATPSRVEPSELAPSAAAAAGRRPVGRAAATDGSSVVTRRSRSIVDERLSRASSTIVHSDRRATSPQRRDDDDGEPPNQFERYGAAESDGGDGYDEFEEHRNFHPPPIDDQMSSLAIPGDTQRKSRQPPSAASQSPVRGRSISPRELSPPRAATSPTNAPEPWFDEGQWFDEEPSSSPRWRPNASRQQQRSHQRPRSPAAAAETSGRQRSSAAAAANANRGDAPRRRGSSPPRADAQSRSGGQLAPPPPPAVVSGSSPSSQRRGGSAPFAEGASHGGRASPQRRGKRPPAKADSSLAPETGDDALAASEGEETEPRRGTAAARPAPESPQRAPSSASSREMPGATGGGGPVDSDARSKRPRTAAAAEEPRRPAPVDLLAENVHEFMEAFEEMEAQNSSPHERSPESAEADAGRPAPEAQARRPRDQAAPAAPAAAAAAPRQDVDPTPVDERTEMTPSSTTERARASADDLDEDDDGLWAAVESQIVPDKAKEAEARRPVRSASPTEAAPSASASVPPRPPPASARGAPTGSGRPSASDARRTPVDEGARRARPPPTTAAAAPAQKVGPSQGERSGDAPRDGRVASRGSPVKPGDGEESSPSSSSVSARLAPADHSSTKSGAPQRQAKQRGSADKSIQTTPQLVDPLPGDAVEDGDRRTGADRQERGPWQQRVDDAADDVEDAADDVEDAADDVEDAADEQKAGASERPRERSASNPQDVRTASHGTQTSGAGPRDLSIRPQVDSSGLRPQQAPYEDMMPMEGVTEVATQTDFHQHASRDAGIKHNATNGKDVIVTPRGQAPARMGSPYTSYEDAFHAGELQAQKSLSEAMKKPGGFTTNRQEPIRSNGRAQGTMKDFADGQDPQDRSTRPQVESSKLRSQQAPYDDMMPMEDVTEVATQTDSHQYASRDSGNTHNVTNGKDMIGTRLGHVERQQAPARIGSLYTSYEDAFHAGELQVQNSLSDAMKKPGGFTTNRQEPIRSNGSAQGTMKDFADGQDHREGDEVNDSSGIGDGKPEGQGRIPSSTSLEATEQASSIVTVDNALYETTRVAIEGQIQDVPYGDLKRKKTADVATIRKTEPSRTHESHSLEGVSEHNDEELRALEAFRDMPSDDKEVFQQLTRTAFERTQARSEAFFSQHGGGLITEAYHNDLPKSDIAKMLEELTMTEKETISEMQTDIGRIRNKRKLDEVRKRRMEFEAYMKHQEKVKALKEGIRQRVHVDHDEQVIRGDYETTTSSNGTLGVDTVEEHVDLGIDDLGVAAIAVRVTAIRILPFEPENDKWRKSSVSVTRTIEIDLLCCEDTKALYVRLQRAHAVARERGRRSPRPAAMDAAETYRVFSALMNITGDGGEDLMLLGSQAEKHYLAALNDAGRYDAPSPPPTSATQSAAAAAAGVAPTPAPSAGSAAHALLSSSSSSSSVLSERRHEDLADGEKLGRPTEAASSGVTAGDGSAGWRQRARVARLEAAAAAVAGAKSPPPPLVAPEGGSTVELASGAYDDRDIYAPLVEPSADSGSSGRGQALRAARDADEAGSPPPLPQREQARHQQPAGVSLKLPSTGDAEPSGGSAAATARRRQVHTASAAIAGRERATNGGGEQLGRRPAGGGGGAMAAARSTASASEATSGQVAAADGTPAATVDFGNEAEPKSKSASPAPPPPPQRRSSLNRISPLLADPRGAADAERAFTPTTSADDVAKRSDGGGLGSVPPARDRAAAAANGFELNGLPVGSVTSPPSAALSTAASSATSLRREYVGPVFRSASRGQKNNGGDGGGEEHDDLGPHDRQQSELDSPGEAFVSTLDFPDGQLQQRDGGGDAAPSRGGSSLRYDYASRRRQSLSRLLYSGGGGGGGAEFGRSEERGARSAASAAAGKLSAAIAGIPHSDTPTTAEDYERVRRRHRDILADMQRLRIAPLAAGDGAAAAEASTAFRQSRTQASDGLF